MPQKIEISHRTIIFALLTLAGVWLVLNLLDVIILLFISLILVSTLRSPVNFLTKKRIPRVLAILIVYILIIAVIVLIFRVVIPPLVEQTSLLVENIPGLINQLNNLLVVNKIPTEQVSSSISSQLGNFGSNAITITAGFLGSLFSILSLFVITFYSLLYWNQITSMIKSVFTGENEKRAERLINNIEAGLGAWVRGQLTLCLIIGTVTYIGLSLLSVPYALPLAIVAGLFEAIPVVGPVIAGIIAILTGFTVSPVIGVATLALYFVIQQLENNLIVPAVMKRAIGINPLITILALIIGAKLYGVVGAILGVPVAVTIKIIISEFFINKISQNQK